MALLTYGSSPAAARTEPTGGTGQPARSRRLRLTRHRSGASAAPPAGAGTLHPQPDADGVIRIDLTAFEQVVRETPARGFPSLATPARGISLPAVEDDAWAGTLLPHEAEPFPATALREPLPGEHWSLDEDAALRRVADLPVSAPAPEAGSGPAPAATPCAAPALPPVLAQVGALVRAGRADAPVPPVEELPEIEPLAMAQLRQELPLIPLEPPALPASFSQVRPAEPAAAPAPVVPPVAQPEPAARTDAAATTPVRPVAATPARGGAAAGGRHPALVRVTVGLGLAAGAAIAIGSAALIATVSTPAEDASPAVTPTITIPGP